MLPVFSMRGEAGATFQVTSTAVAQSLSAAVLTVGGKAMKAMMISVDVNPVTIAMGGATPVVDSGGLGHYLVPLFVAPFHIIGTYACSTFKFIDGDTGNHGILNITPFY